MDAEWITLSGVLGGAATVTYDRKGNVRPGAAAGHEHFGWQDGISQPGINGLTDPFPGQGMVEKLSRLAVAVVTIDAARPAAMPLGDRHGACLVDHRHGREGLPSLDPVLGIFEVDARDARRPRSPG